MDIISGIIIVCVVIVRTCCQKCGFPVCDKPRGLLGLVLVCILSLLAFYYDRLELARKFTTTYSKYLLSA